MSAVSLNTLAEAVQAIPDPRSKQGVTHPYHGMLALVILGLLAGMPYLAHIRRWAKKHWHTLREPLNFKRTYPPVETTISRALARTSVADFQAAFADFLRNLLAEDHDTLTAAVDGKVAKQFRDANGDPLLLLNIFAHELKVTLADYSVRGDTVFQKYGNEPGCLKAHLDTLFSQYPFLNLLTGDAIFAQRPLLEVLQEHDCDYLFQIKDNQGDILEAAKTCFADASPDNADDESVEKRGPMLKYEHSGAMSPTPSTSVSG